ncbi:hypothetical protein SEA_ARGIE_89 [Mycobacterium phage Argie]|nr:hypothetical protein SEA_ARGIE_89 [Mycobacterium phage Argie]
MTPIWGVGPIRPMPEHFHQHNRPAVTGRRGCGETILRNHLHRKGFHHRLRSLPAEMSPPERRRRSPRCPI